MRLRAQRATLTALLSDGTISEPVYEELVAQVDAALMGDNGGEPEAPSAALGS